MEEDGEWMVALKEALALRPPRPGETGGQPKGRQRATKAVQGPPPTRGGQKKPEPAAGKGTAAPTGAGAAAQGSAARKKPHRPSSPWGQEEDEVQVAGLGTPFFSVRYVTFFYVLKKEHYVLFHSFLKFLATYGTQKQGWALRSFPFRTFRSFRSKKRMLHSFPFFSRVFGDL